jgi:nitrate/nitrite-specific signal transduction histidine kinase
MELGTVEVTQYALVALVKGAKHSLSFSNLLLYQLTPLSPAACQKVQMVVIVRQLKIVNIQKHWSSIATVAIRKN